MVRHRAARDAIALFGTDEVTRFRECANPNCELMFVDHSRAGFGAWMEFWGQRTNPPAVTGLFVAGLAHPDFLVEIEATAAIAG